MYDNKLNASLWTYTNKNSIADMKIFSLTMKKSEKTHKQEATEHKLNLWHI